MAEALTAYVPVLALHGVNVDFTARGRAVRAVDDVSLTIGAGETVALVGESGSGKSVTSLAVMGLLPAGQAEVTGQIMFRRGDAQAVDLCTLPRAVMPEIRGAEIAMIFQEPMTSLNPLHSIGAQISEMLVIHRRAGRAAARDLAQEMLARVGIPDPVRRMASYPHELSGGMRQRVMIAMALTCNPTLLIADEPTTALDVTIQAQIMELFRTLRDLSHQAMLFITHDLGLVAEIANRVYVMYAGQVVESGPVRAIFRRPLHPYTRGLLASLPRIDRPQRDGKPLYSIAGRVPEPGRMPQGCRFAPRCTEAVAGRCDAVPPALEPATTTHAVRCLRWRELAGAEDG